MAKKEIIAFDPPTEEEIMLIQPNNVTFGQYNVSEWQENLLTLIGDKIQKHMTREEELPRDLFNQPYVVIMCDEAGGKNNKNKVLKEAIDMLNKRFSFRWLHPKMKKEIEDKKNQLERERMDHEMKLQAAKDKAAMERERLKAKTAIKNKVTGEK